MVREAETHAEDDRKFQELVSVRNQAEALVHATRKTLSEVGDKVSGAERQSVEQLIDDLETVVATDDKAAIEQKSKALSDASTRLAENLYAQAGAAEQPTHGGVAEEGVIDADFEDISNDKGHAA
jgi:molecular chaperone DnaK